MNLQRMIELADEYTTAMEHAQDASRWSDRKKTLAAWDEAIAVADRIARAGFANPQDLLAQVNTWRNL